MALVTVASGAATSTLDFNVSDRALTLAQQIASAITSTYGSTGIKYSYNNPPAVPASGGYVYDTNPKPGQTINVTGFSAVVIQNNSDPTSIPTILGGGSANQVVLGGDGGLAFVDTTDTKKQGATVVLGGGNNFINFKGSKGTEAAYIASGNNTLIGGDGSTTFYAGTGDNAITLGGGTSSVTVTGSDTIQLGKGTETISVDPSVLGASATVFGAAKVSNANVTDLVFTNGVAASEVTGGAGSYSIFGGVGGGVYTGGSAGNNVLVGGTGSVTLTAGGNGDYLEGQSQHDLLIGGSGSETLYASGGSTIVGGSGPDQIEAGSGYANPVHVEVGTGVDTIYAFPGISPVGASVLVDKVTAAPSGLVGGGHYSMFFIGSNVTSTVLGGLGSFYINASSGGGTFTGGSDGDNYMFATSGSVTMTGGGAGDYLAGGSAGDNLLTAAMGNSTLVASAGGSDTLVAGSGQDTLSLVNEVPGKTYTVEGYSTADLLLIDPANAASATLPGAVHVSGSTSTITLADNTKIILVGYTGNINVG